MRYAIVSDIHGNQQAWKAVLEDIASVGVDETICLGDIVGYGPCPAEVLESVWERAADIVLGNHDAVVGGQLDPEIFTENAKRMINWTMETLDPALHHLLADVPYVLEGDGFTMAHAELTEPDRFAYIDNEQDAAENFTTGDQPILFVGHSHVPKIFVLDEDSGDVGQLPVHDLVAREGQRYIVNVGSVGDPRDGRTLASYCLFDSDKQLVSHRSVAFDIEEFRADLESRCVPVKPWFLMCWDKQGAGSRRIDEWSKNVRTVVRPKKRIVIRRMRKTIEDSRQARLETEQALARKREIQRSVEDAKEARIERQRLLERRREGEGAAVREALRLRREAAAVARKKREEEEKATGEKALAEKKERITAVAKLNAVRKQGRGTKPGALGEIPGARKLAATRNQQHEQPEPAGENIDQLRQRKLEIAKAAEQRLQAKRDALGTRQEKRDAERERVRKQIERRRQLAAEKKAAAGQSAPERGTDSSSTAKARKAEPADQKAELVRQRRLELAKAAERRMKAKREARGAIKEKREAERERVRKQIERRKQLAAEKRTASDEPLSTDGEDPRPRGPRPTGDQ